MRFDRRPSPAAYMLRALIPFQRRRRSASFPPVHASWSRYRVDQRHLADFLRLTGLRADRGLPLLYPHVLGFPLQMAILTHPAFPLPIWNSLQIRNNLIRHRPIPADETLDLETRVAAQRILEKGVEVDLHTGIRARGELVWESLNTFYYRGHRGQTGPASALARAPVVNGEVLAQWHMAAGPGWRFGRLTGDYNPVHWSRWYARRFGFRQAFHHPQLVIGQCLARLPESDPAQTERLDAWLKGPVYYDSDVRLRATAQSGGTAFALAAADEVRPAIVGCWRSASTSESLSLQQPGAEDRNGSANGRLAH